MIGLATVVVGCLPKATKDPQCAMREREIVDKIKHPTRPPTLQAAGEWGNPKGGFSWVIKQTGAVVKIDVGHVLPDDRGRSVYQVEGTMDGVVDGPTLYYYERSQRPGEGSFGSMTLTNGELSGPRWAKGGGECYLNAKFKQVRI